MSDYVEVYKKYWRPTEVNALVGDPSRAKAELGWTASTKWEGLARLIVDFELKNLDY